MDKHSWLISVLDDIEDYTGKNGLQKFGAHIIVAKHVLLDEMETTQREGEGQTVPTATVQLGLSDAAG